MTVCCICIDEDSNCDIHLDNCKHEFHKVCVDEWLKKNILCPLCRVPTTNTFKIQFPTTINNNYYQKFINIGSNSCSIYDKKHIIYYIPYKIIVNAEKGKKTFKHPRGYYIEHSYISLNINTNDSQGFATIKKINFFSLHCDNIIQILNLHLRS